MPTNLTENLGAASNSDEIIVIESTACNTFEKPIFQTSQNPIIVDENATPISVGQNGTENENPEEFIDLVALVHSLVEQDII